MAYASKAASARQLAHALVLMVLVGAPCAALADDQYVTAMSPTADGGIVVAGHKNGMNRVIKIDGHGDVVWRSNPGNSDHSYSSGIAQTAGGDFLMAGVQYVSGIQPSSTKGEGLIRRISGDGAVVWSKELNLMGKELTLGKIAKGISGNFLIVGTVKNEASPDNNKGYLISINEDGDVLWEREYDHGNITRMLDVVAYEDGYAALGWVRDAPNAWNRTFLAVIDNSGSTRSHREIRDAAHYETELTSLSTYRSGTDIGLFASGYAWIYGGSMFDTATATIFPARDQVMLEVGNAPRNQEYDSHVYVSNDHDSYILTSGFKSIGASDSGDSTVWISRRNSSGGGGAWTYEFPASDWLDRNTIIGNFAGGDITVLADSAIWDRTPLVARFTSAGQEVWKKSLNFD